MYLVWWRILLLHSDTFEIKGIIVSSGFITNLLRGKRIMLINELILGEENLLIPSKLR